MATLEEETLVHLNGYLAGTMDGREVSAWALAKFVSNEAKSEVLDHVLADLSLLDHEDPQWDTPRADLEFWRDCLTGKKSYQPATQVRRVG